MRREKGRIGTTERSGEGREVPSVARRSERGRGTSACQDRERGQRVSGGGEAGGVPGDLLAKRVFCGLALFRPTDHALFQSKGLHKVGCVRCVVLEGSQSPQRSSSPLLLPCIAMPYACIVVERLKIAKPTGGAASAL